MEGKCKSCGKVMSAVTIEELAEAFTVHNEERHTELERTFGITMKFKETVEV